MRGRLGLDGGMIPRGVKRLFDQRGEPREPVEPASAMLGWRGRETLVDVTNLSLSGAMVTFGQIPHIGETVTLQLAECRRRTASVRWVRDGRIGLNFDDSPDDDNRESRAWG